MQAHFLTHVLESALKTQLVLLLLLGHALCSPDDCSGEEIQPSSIYALQVDKNATLSRTVKVYSKNCSTLSTVGPSWYTLEVIGSASLLGDFHKPSKYSGAVLANEVSARSATGCAATVVIHFDGGEEPLAILDLPRRYKWELHQEKNVFPLICFRLIIQQGNSCEQVLTDDCDPELFMDKLEFDIPTLPTTTEAVVVTTQQPGPIKTLEECVMMKARLNCTGKRDMATCGTDGNWYRNKCTMRLRRCMYAIDSLQRDLENKSCKAPAPAAFPPDATLPPPPPTISMEPTPSPCAERRQEFLALPHPQPPTCLNQKYYKRIQCWEDFEGVYCVCADPYTGNPITDIWYPADCDSPILAEPPPGRCRI